MTTAIYTGVRVARPCPQEHEVQIVAARKPYVYGTARNNALIHRVNHLRMRWWEFDYGYMLRRQSPRINAVTNCGRYIRLSDTSGKLCGMPRLDAVLCGMCHGRGRNFPRGKEHEIPMEIAKVRLGCIEVPE